MDEFKKYIQTHKETLDQDEPNQLVWLRICEEVGLVKEVKGVREVKGVKKVVRVVFLSKWMMAACVVGLAGLGIGYLLNDTKTEMSQNIVKSNASETKPESVQKNVEMEMKSSRLIIAKINESKPNHTRKTEQNKVMGSADLSTLQNLEISFTQVINLQKARISSMPMNAESANYFNDFRIQITQMELDEKVIKSDIAKRGMNDVLLDQLINVYQQKLNVLKQLQIEMNKTNNRFKQNRGPIDSVKTYFLNL